MVPAHTHTSGTSIPSAELLFQWGGMLGSFVICTLVEACGTLVIEVLGLKMCIRN